MRYASFVLLFAWSAPADVVVIGTVRDADSRQVIPNAKVRLAGFRLADGKGPMSLDLTVVTDRDGAFLAKLPGTGYEVVARGKANGYRSHPDSTLARNGQVLRITGDSTRVEVLVYRVSELHGTVVDEVSRKPIAGAAVQLWDIRWARGIRHAGPIGGARTVTDSSGNFSFRNLTPNEYYVEATASSGGSEKGRAYRPAFFPATPRSEAGLAIGAGTRLDVGNIILRSVPVRKITGRITGDCERGRRFQVEAVPASPRRYPPVATVTGTCGGVFELQQIPEGHYEVTIRSESGQPADGLYGASEVRLQGRDGEVTLQAVGIATLRTLIRWPEDVERPEVTQPVVTLKRGGETWQREGSSEAPIWDATPFREYELQCQPPPGWAVTRVSMNGAPAPGTWKADGGRQDQLELTLAPRSATVTGEIKGGELKGDSAQTVILVIPWPLRGSAEYPEHETVPVLESRYQMNLAPGSYRMLGLRRDDLAQMEKPYLLREVAAKAAEVKLGEHQQRLVDLELPRH